MRMFCSQCGATIEAGAAHCPRCGSAQPRVAAAAATTQPVMVVVHEKSPGVAVVLSFFFTGLGQLYNGEIAKGLLMMVGMLFSWLAIYLLIGLLTTPALWIWGMIDAYESAERINLEARARLSAVVAGAR